MQAYKDWNSETHIKAISDGMSGTLLFTAKLPIVLEMLSQEKQIDEIVKDIRQSVPFAGSIVSDRRALTEVITKFYAELYSTQGKSSSTPFVKPVEKKALVLHKLNACHTVIGELKLFERVQEAQSAVQRVCSFFCVLSPEEGREVISEVFTKTYQAKKQEIEAHLDKFLSDHEHEWAELRGANSKQDREALLGSLMSKLSLKSCIEYAVMSNMAQYGANNSTAWATLVKEEAEDYFALLHNADDVKIGKEIVKYLSPIYKHCGESLMPLKQRVTNPADPIFDRSNAKLERFRLNLEKLIVLCGINPLSHTRMSQLQKVDKSAFAELRAA